MLCVGFMLSFFLGSSMFCHVGNFYGWVIFHCMNIVHFVYAFIYWIEFELFSSLWLLWIVLLGVHTYNFLFICLFKSLGIKSLKLLAYVQFSLWRNCQTVHSHYVISYFQVYCMKLLRFSHSQHLLFSILLSIADLYA